MSDTSRDSKPTVLTAGPAAGKTAGQHGADGASPPTPPSPGTSRELAVLLIGQAMATMATAVVNVAAPAIGKDLGISGSALQLVASGYVLAYAILLITGARLGDWGHRRLFTGGLALFTAAALLSGAAPNGGVLICGQILQGIGAALMVPQVLSLIQLRFDGVRRAKALGLYALVLAVGVAAGQVLGGLLVTTNLFGLAWRSVFLINVPVGLLLMAAARTQLPSTRAEVRRRLDLVGVGLLSASILLVVVPLTFGNSQHWPAWTWVAIAAGVVTLLAFLWAERRMSLRGGQPLLDLDAITPRGIRAGLAVVFLVMAAYGTLLFTTAVHLQEGLQYTPLRSGLTFCTYAFGFATVNLTWSRLPGRLHRWVPVTGLIGFTVANVLLGVVTAGTWNFAVIAPLLVVAGAGHGAGFGALVPQIASRAKPAHAAAISGLVTTLTQLAIVVGIAALGSVYLGKITPGVTTSFQHGLSLVFYLLAALTAVAAGFALRLAKSR